MSLGWPLADPAVRSVAVRALVLIAAGMTALWLASLRRRDVSIVDVFWGTGFALLALYYTLATDGAAGRTMLLAALTIAWGGRLSLHIARRNRGKPEDPRYAAWREQAGPSFPLRSLFTVFLLQGALMWLISMPLLVGISSPVPPGLTWLDGIGVAVWTVGFLFETVGDEQLRRFKADAANRGQVLQTGLWRYTRHPNYFGDAMVWWGLFLIALSAPGAVWTVFSPALMTFLLMRVSGVTLLEKGLRASKPGYAEYVARTSPFFPWPPKE